jgi:hypothetical protein
MDQISAQFFLQINRLPLVSLIVFSTQERYAAGQLVVPSGLCNQHTASCSNLTRATWPFKNPLPLLLDEVAVDQIYQGFAVHPMF